MSAQAGPGPSQVMVVKVRLAGARLQAEAA